jgi:hypothetical protein
MPAEPLRKLILGLVIGGQGMDQGQTLPAAYVPGDRPGRRHPCHNRHGTGN